MKKILFISHDATLTGAPKLLLNLIKCLDSGGFGGHRIIIKNDVGSLAIEFRKYAEVHLNEQKLSEPRAQRLGKIEKATASIFGERKGGVIQDWINEADVIFSNTITNGDFLAKFTFRRHQLIVSYIHELQMAANYYTTPKDLAVLLAKTNLFCVPCAAVKTFLIQKLLVSEDKIKQLNYFVPTKDFLRQVTPVNISNFVVGMIGTLDWRKGAELLPAIVCNFFKKFPGTDVKFFWKGVDFLSIEYLRIEFELKKTGLIDKVFFEESTHEVADFYNAIDLLLLCSKEDPYPMVILEAANYEKPSLCFGNSGGGEEFIGKDAGTIVPFDDIDAMTTSIYNYYNDRGMWASKGRTAREKLIRLHNNEALIQKQFINLFVKN